MIEFRDVTVNAVISPQRRLVESSDWPAGRQDLGGNMWHPKDHGLLQYLVSRCFCFA